MAITGIFFGSDTGNTENIAKMIQKQLGKDVADVHDIAKSSKEDLEGYDILLLGIPTWYYGACLERIWKSLNHDVCINNWPPI